MVQTSDKFAVWLALGRIFSMVATFVMPLILTRYLTLSDYGVFSQFFTLYTVLYAMFAFGIHTNLFFFYPNASKKQKNDSVGNTLLLLCIIGLLFGTIMLFPQVQQLIFGESPLSEYKILVIICIVLAVPLNIVSALFSVREDKLCAVVFPALFAFLRILTVVALGIAFQNIWVIMEGMVIYQFIMTVLTFLYSFRSDNPSINWKLMKEQLCYSLPFGIAVTLQLLSNYFDKIVSITLLSPTDYAIYSVAFLSIPGVNQLYDSLVQVNIINMSKCYQCGEYNQIVPLYRNFVQKTLSFSSPLIIVAALYAEEIIGFLFTAEYSNAALYFRIYSLTFLISMFGAGTILRSVNKTKFSMVAFIASCSIGLPITYYLIKMYGIDGAILSAVVNIVLPRFIQMGIEVRVMKQKVSTYLPWKNIMVIWGISSLYLIPLIIIKKLYSMPLIICIILSAIYIFLVYWHLVKRGLFIISSSAIKSRITTWKTIAVKKFR